MSSKYRFSASEIKPDGVPISSTVSTPRVVQKPWGSELWFAHTDLYAGKLLRVRAGCRLSVQYHESKDETSFVLSGRVVVTQGDSQATLRSRELGPGASWRNTPGMVHTLEAIDDAEVVEVSTPEVTDVIRLEDRYGRIRAGQDSDR